MQNNNKITEYQKSMKLGTLRELEAIKLFMKQDFTVSVPNINARYDFIAESYPKILRVQVKNLKLKKDSTDNPQSYKTWCIRPWTVAYGKKRPYTKDDCDMIVGINLDTGDYAVVPVHEVSGNAAEYRLSKHEDSNGKKYLNSWTAVEELLNNPRS